MNKKRQDITGEKWLPGIAAWFLLPPIYSLMIIIGLYTEGEKSYGPLVIMIGGVFLLILCGPGIYALVNKLESTIIERIQMIGFVITFVFGFVVLYGPYDLVGTVYLFFTSSLLLIIFSKLIWFYTIKCLERGRVIGLIIIYVVIGFYWFTFFLVPAQHLFQSNGMSIIFCIIIFGTVPLVHIILHFKKNLLLPIWGESNFKM
jgi:hypothetical protein